MFIASGSKHHGIYRVFVPVPSKSTGIYALFTMLQDVISIVYMRKYAKRTKPLYFTIFASRAQEKMSKHG